MATMYVINKGLMKNNIGMQFIREILREIILGG